MIVTAWNNGYHHSDSNGYGLRIKIEDRDKFIKRSWGYLFFDLEGKEKPISLNIQKNSFWNGSCRELISKEIGVWLVKNKFAPWEKGSPPKFNLIPIEKNHFRLERM